MSRRPRPPRPAAWLAGISVPPSDRANLLGDLEERFSARAAAGTERDARCWYWEQTLRIVVVLGPRRLAGALPRLIAPGTARAAFRSLVRSPAASAASVLTLGVGIAAPLAIFALADGVTASLPGDAADRVLRVARVDRQGRVHMGFSRAVVDQWAGEAAGPDRALVELAAFRSEGFMSVAGGDTAARRERGVWAMSALFRLVDVEPVAGRLYADQETSSLPVVVVREDLAEERFGGGPDALGQVLEVDRADHLVVGVLPREFGLPVDHRLWIQPRPDDGAAWGVAGRLAPGAPPEAAIEQLSGAAASVAPESDDSEERTLTAARFTEAHFFSAREPETTRRVGTLSLLLVVLTAINVAALMVARGVSRSRETAVRLAVGAGRSQVIALTLVEGLFLAAAGGALGLGLGRAALQGMVSYLTGQAVVVPYWLDFRLGPRSLAMAALFTLLALCVAALLPAVHASGASLDRTLRRSRAGAPGSGARAMRWLVGVVVALSCFLLAISSVVVEEALDRLGTGAEFATDGLVSGRFVLEPPAYTDADARRDFLARLVEAVEADPAVQSVSFASALPGREGAVVPAGVAGGSGPDDLASAQVRGVDPSFLPLLGASPRAGRLLSEADDVDARAVAVVNEAFVRQHEITNEVLGREIVVERLRAGGPHRATVVGVVDDRGITPAAMGRPTPGVYLPLDQVPSTAPWLLVRTRPGTSLFDVWHRSVAPLDPHLALGEVLTLEETLRRGHGAATLFMSIFLSLGGVTLLMALVGLHGVHAFTLAGRIQVIGVRRALGARSGQVLAAGVRRAMRPVWLGLLVGLPPGILVARSVVPLESPSRGWLLVPPLVLLTAVFAVWRPTRKAALVEPAKVLGEL